MNYIDSLAVAIHRAADPKAPVLNERDLALYRIYAVLALAKGTATTRQDVHAAWSAWMAGIKPDHTALRPFDSLSPSVQELDQQDVEAIHAVAASLEPA